jgi:NADH-quinone oxidoreductase subunit M
MSGWLGQWSSFTNLDSSNAMAAFGLLMLAVLLRKGLFPVHGWVVAAHESGHLPTSALLINGHVAAFLVLRVVIPILPEASSSALVLITDIALLTALYAALMALSERSPRRIFALLSVSQSSFVLAGLETGTPEGISGALVYWMVVTIATTGIAIVLQAIEQRMQSTGLEGSFLGLAGPFPRLATFFIVCGVALVGMPGTLGFIADELLLHGALESHPRLGLVMPLAAALNAFHLYRLFSRLFLGSKGPQLSGIPDARLGERLALTAALALLVVGGLMPARTVGLRSAAADAIVNRLSPPAAHGD